MSDLLGQSFDKGGKPTPKVRTHHEKQLVENVKADLAKMFPTVQESDIDKLIRRLKQDIAHVNASLQSIDDAVKAAGQDHKRADLVEFSQSAYLQLLDKYTKDELHMLFTCVLADLSIKNVV